ncbi:juvenile hormone esterase-like [Vanessa cardui]|uniref:juvenile hormone esterase-like n=1 Tax=Vanessa cardui TaxID=171605 RepID=UPI001F12A6DA|nr:juvenile hormone esterase-like [Vanessa cardui]
MWYLFMCLLFLLGRTTSELDSRLVEITQGPVRGYKDPIEDIFVFYGIPYAKAPTGPQRFKEPLPPPIWVQTLEAVDNGIICPQFKAPTVADRFLPKDKIMQEDCLIANIYVPNTDKKDLPVVVYVHGGGFIVGHGNYVTPKKFVNNRNIIAVTFNYRLGAHGFLCLGTKDIPGNAGMKDQVALLQWVQKNIKSFRGNPNDVTLAGYSAGSASVDLIILSKMAKGLFNKVIAESGVNISPFSVQMDPSKNAKEYARSIGFENVDDINELQDFFKTIPYDLLQSANVLYRTDSEFLTAPCVERDVGQVRFLEDSPVNIIKSGNSLKLPILYGFAEMEGAFRIDLFDHTKDELNANFTDFMPSDLTFKNMEEKHDIANRVRRFYFGDKPISDNTVIEHVDLFTDIVFACPTLRTLKNQVKAGNNQIYLYEYSFVDESTPLIPYTNVRGANHCAQTNAVMDGVNMTLSDESSISEDFKKIKGLMRDLWAKFITTGKPESQWVPRWPTAGEKGSPHMCLKMNPELRDTSPSVRCQLWEEIYEKHYRHPIMPSHPTMHNEL